MNQPTTTALSAASRLALGRCTLDMAVGELLDAQDELAALRKQALEVLLVLGRGWEERPQQCLHTFGIGAVERVDGAATVPLRCAATSTKPEGVKRSGCSTTALAMGQ